ncbi:probable lysophospholipase BODYGUARD 4 isoform X2 [Asparagus officinalis]|uniref:probable lysophospholipase BODYGUARD 4 isoform X1 n=1 Tax=Asparagus officinalis TaxID=4686 RepID=UPI00098E69B3|nr:probable lysophospholipase BODYGUARD 4 isoform X1 [Asparagus officinalis]XP_020274446.1 probable lysophospholipase BODYGUARD 4 isoform X2 [Asparagus officinalis]
MAGEGRREASLCRARGAGSRFLLMCKRDGCAGTSQPCGKSSTENVIFLHGFLSSSSFWVETVFPNLSAPANSNLRIFAVDLLGFGKSPKPTNCLYTLQAHTEQIEKSVLETFQLNTFHLVAHSMGCTIAISLAAKHPESVKSITLTAPPYFPSTEEEASYTALNRLAERKVWPPLVFGSSIMSWYEHLGRTICFFICRNHLKWEWIMKLVTRKKDVHFKIADLTMHTHHSAWHTMHNVLCGGAKLLDNYFEILKREEILVKLIHGANDGVIPLECSYNIKLKVPLAELQIIHNADHISVIQGREEEFTKELEDFWFSSAKREVSKYGSSKIMKSL